MTSKISPVPKTKENTEANTRQNQALWGSGFRLARYPGPVLRGQWPTTICMQRVRCFAQTWFCFFSSLMLFPGVNQSGQTTRTLHEVEYFVCYNSYSFQHGFVRPTVYYVCLFSTSLVLVILPQVVPELTFETAERCYQQLFTLLDFGAQISHSKELFSPLDLEPS
jgi:hypothetical protein